MKNQEQEFKEVIRSLELLRNIKPEPEFRNRMEMKLRPARRFGMPFYALRIALVVLLVLMSGSGVVAVASNSHPGEALYPVKQIVDSVKTNFTPPTEITQTPTVEPQKQTPEKAPDNKAKQLSPTPSAPMQKQTLPASTEQTPEIQPTPTPTQTPTPTPVINGVIPAVQDAVNTVLPIVPIGGASEPTPTPQPKNEGSKDNGSNAGAGGSLLPKIKIGPILQ